MSEPEGAVGDLAIVLHSHMPYVEGFGTYPFGEEWLFDAIVRSYLPVLDVARDLTLTVTPVLADQLEADGVPERLDTFLREYRIGSAQVDIDTCDDSYRPACVAEHERYTRAAELLDGFGGDPLAAFREASDSGRVCLAASSATHAVLPLLASQKGLDLQIATGIESHRRRFGWTGGFWLPECAYVPGLEWDLAREGVDWFCTDQSRYESGDDALAPVATSAGPTAFTIDWPSVSWLWDLEGYPSWPGYLDFHRLSMNGIRIFGIDGEAADPQAAGEKAREQAESFLASVVKRLVAYRERTGEKGTLVFAVDCELLGHWWSEGPQWLEHVLAGAAGAGINLRPLDQSGVGTASRDDGLRPSTWGEKKDFRTWDSPEVADLAWGARKLELRVMQDVKGLDRNRAERAVREMLGAQASDWAFLDGRRQAGDYAWQRSLDHSEAAYEALDCGNDVLVDSRMRSLAPDLDLAPLLEP
jgi:1,4-alpha-glucan branching enzyme